MRYVLSYLVFLISVYVSSPLYAFIQVQGKAQSTLHINLLQDGLTRLTIEGDRIRDVIGLTGQYELKNHALTGDVFIKPADEKKKIPFSFFITSERGLTYEVIAMPVSKADQTIVIVPEKRKESLTATTFIQGSYEDTLTQAIRQLAAGKVPEGFTAVTSRLSKRQRFLPNVTGRLIKRYQSLSLNVDVYRLTNTGRKTRRLQESDVSTPTTLVAALVKHILKPHETTTFYRVSRHERT